MNNPQTGVNQATEKPMWLKIWHFPLVVMATALLALLGALALVEWVMQYLPAGLNPTTKVFISYGLRIIAVLGIYKLVVRHLGAHRHDDLPSLGAASDTALGLGVGLAVFTCVVGAAAVFGYYRVLGMGGWNDFLEIILVTGLSAGLVEEIIFRGIIFRWLEEWAGSWAALLVSAILFGFSHFFLSEDAILPALLIALEAGLLLGAAYMLTRSLWMAIGIHAGWNIAQAFIWGLPIARVEYEGLLLGQTYGPQWLSGGAYGLELSIFGVVIGTLAGLYLLWQAAKEGHVIRPSWSRK